MGKIADFIRKLLGIPKGKRDRRVSAVLVAILKSEEKLSYWGLVKHFAKHPGDLERCELDRPYSKSWYHLRISQIGDFILHEIIGWMAGDAAVHGTKIVDSTGFSISRYRDWHNAKYGTISVKQFAKLHIVHALGGKICAAAVTPGKANDSPYLREMLARMRIRRHTGRCPIRRSQKLPDGTGQWTPPRNRAQIRLYDRGRRRQGGDVEVS